MMCQDSAMKQNYELQQLQELAMNATKTSGYYQGLYVATVEALGKIEAKKQLKLPLTQRERALWTLYGKEDRK